jgi:hypothetical protein
MLHAMLMPSAEGARQETPSCVLPPLSHDQVMHGGKTTVHICNTTLVWTDYSP